MSELTDVGAGYENNGGERVIDHYNRYIIRSQMEEQTPRQLLTAVELEDAHKLVHLRKRVQSALDILVGKATTTKATSLTINASAGGAGWLFDAQENGLVTIETIGYLHAVIGSLTNRLNRLGVA